MHWYFATEPAVLASGSNNKPFFGGLSQTAFLYAALIYENTYSTSLGRPWGNSTPQLIPKTHLNQWVPNALATNGSTHTWAWGVQTQLYLVASYSCSPPWRPNLLHFKAKKILPSPVIKTFLLDPPWSAKLVPPDRGVKILFLLHSWARARGGERKERPTHPRHTWARSNFEGGDSRFLFQRGR